MPFFAPRVLNIWIPSPHAMLAPPPGGEDKSTIGVVLMEQSVVVPCASDLLPGSAVEPEGSAGEGKIGGGSIQSCEAGRPV